MKNTKVQNYRVFRRVECVCFAAVLLTLTACGSAKPKESDGSDTIPAAVDAGTDAVPQPVTDAPPPADGALPPAAAAPMPDPAAAAAPAPATPATPDPAPAQAQSDTYTIKEGDTLMKIAFEVLGDVYKWREIYEANKDKISDPNRISKDVVLNVTRPATPVTMDQNGEKYLIKKGDTLGSISGQLYGTPSKWKDLWENNKQLIHDPNKIFAGFYLHYNPAGASTTLGSSKPADANAAPPGAAPAPAADPAAGAMAGGAPAPGPGTPSMDPAAAGVPAGAPAPGGPAPAGTPPDASSAGEAPPTAPGP